ncbi:MAG: hypothetical protein M3151_10770 [Actinomycetota bacterium]|nr:hypothetical protein [Actinomycetota bacterium]
MAASSAVPLRTIFERIDVALHEQLRFGSKRDAHSSAGTTDSQPAKTTGLAVKRGGYDDGEE